MITEKQKQDFARCIEAALLAEHETKGIGTLGERTLHVILKSFFQPDKSRHEIKIGRYFADAVTDEGILEVQTRAFSSMRKKLSELTKVSHVNLVYPIAAVKYVSWVDPETGEISGRRRSPKIGKAHDVLYELYALRPMLPMEDLSLTLVFMDMDEFRLLNGWGKNKKHGASRCERVPTALVDIITLRDTADYTALLPEGLPESFTAKQFAKSAKMTPRTAGYAIRTLATLGVIAHTGEEGKAFIYEKMM